MYYVGKDGRQSGPFTLEELRAMVGKDQLHVDDLVWKEGMPQWIQAGALPGLFGSAAVPPPPLGISPPGAQASHGYPPPTFEEVPSYLWQSIVLLLLCCPLFGIPAVVHATQVDKKMVVGDVTGARQSSKKARFWCWMCVVFSLINFAITIWYAYQHPDLFKI
ncbi:CD225/dispanin family protein [Verrucomicrobium sp. BvORR106]|uniref:CD225/dispanin family protein n=1 Tax=Verrucomicrobium sp. BvORR106 TaxID=1403819 RepID=UPI000691A05A|nr:CD225/dispanin family protein [Verrucomicrobium sp. BvORR106]